LANDPFRDDIHGERAKEQEQAGECGQDFCGESHESWLMRIAEG
jgi:hypothetical protein